MSFVEPVETNFFNVLCMKMALRQAQCPVTLIEVPDWSRRKKEALISGEYGRLPVLAKSCI